jgi:S-(hydroxymethyl)glutathione dehydrogenase / alcohol dehydrogenase
MSTLMDKIMAEEFDPREIITHTLPLEEAANGYDLFNDHKEDCIKVVLKT